MTNQLTLKAQDLQHHQWKNRILLVITNNTMTQSFQEQMLEFRKNRKGLIERKLLIYEITPTQYHLIDHENTTHKDHRINTDSLYATHNKANAPFTVVLIGLDGGIKLEKRTFLSAEELFRIIDSMPMRAAEMRRKN